MIGGPAGIMTWILRFCLSTFSTMIDFWGSSILCWYKMFPFNITITVLALSFSISRKASSSVSDSIGMVLKWDSLYILSRVSLLNCLKMGHSFPINISISEVLKAPWYFKRANWSLIAFKLSLSTNDSIGVWLITESCYLCRIRSGSWSYSEFSCISFWQYTLMPSLIMKLRTESILNFWVTSIIQSCYLFSSDSKLPVCER